MLGIQNQTTKSGNQSCQGILALLEYSEWKVIILKRGFRLEVRVDCPT